MVTDVGALEVRWVDPDRHPADLPQLVWLFRDAYPDQNWAQDDFLRFTRNRTANNVIKLLVGGPDDQNPDRVYAANLYSVEPNLVRCRRAAVDPDFRRRGLGTYLLSFLIGPRSAVRRRRFVAKVGEYDVAGQCFARSLGFKVPAGGIGQRDMTGPAVYTFQLDRDSPKPVLT